MEYVLDRIFIKKIIKVGLNNTYYHRRKLHDVPYVLTMFESHAESENLEKF